jgi:hypothetical protein
LSLRRSSRSAGVPPPPRQRSVRRPPTSPEFLEARMAHRLLWQQRPNDGAHVMTRAPCAFESPLRRLPSILLLDHSRAPGALRSSVVACARTIDTPMREGRPGLSRPKTHASCATAQRRSNLNDRRYIGIRDRTWPILGCVPRIDACHLMGCVDMPSAGITFALCV